MKDKLIQIPDYLSCFADYFPSHMALEPWEIVRQLPDLIRLRIASLPANEYRLHSEGVLIHHTAIIESGVILKSPLIISSQCFVGAHAYLRGGVLLGKSVVVGPGCEIKTSTILDSSALAHFNFVGDSLLGAGVNMEAGSIIANHFNEREDKTIQALTDVGRVTIPSVKFGALVGDQSKIGANAVLSPGTILKPKAIVGRLTLVDQSLG